MKLDLLAQRKRNVELLNLHLLEKSQKLQQQQFAKHSVVT